MPTLPNIQKPAEKKICNTCKEEKSLSDFYFRKESNNYRSECKKCVFERNKKNILNRKDFIKINRESKICSACKTEKKISDFYKNNKSSDGHAWTCKECCSIYKKENFDKEKYNISHKKYYEKNREKVREYQDNYRLNNKERAAQWAKNSAARRQDYIKNYQKEYYIKNRELVNQRNSKNSKFRRQNDPVFKLIENNRRRINKALKSRSLSSIKLLGCTGREAYHHLLKNGFRYGMHIDHIIPLSLFDLNKESHQKIAFNFLNLQPLTESENHNKYNKLPENFENVLDKICNFLKIDSDDIISYFKNIELKKVS